MTHEDEAPWYAWERMPDDARVALLIFSHAVAFFLGAYNGVTDAHEIPPGLTWSDWVLAGFVWSIIVTVLGTLAVKFLSWAVSTDLGAR